MVLTGPLKNDSLQPVSLEWLQIRFLRSVFPNCTSTCAGTTVPCRLETVMFRNYEKCSSNLSGGYEVDGSHFSDLPSQRFHSLGTFKGETVKMAMPEKSFACWYFTLGMPIPLPNSPVIEQTTTVKFFWSCLLVADTCSANNEPVLPLPWGRCSCNR